MNKRWIGYVGAAGVAASALAMGVVSPAFADPCAPGGNPVVCENSKPGTPQSTWDIDGIGDSTIQGFATSMSVNVGETERFKVDTSATAYTVEIYRLGWYGGNGARKVADVTSTPQTQPSCLTDATTGLVDCGNWAVSASWAVPSDAVSGVYIAKLTRTDTGGASHIPFVVRDDSSHSDLLFQTSDTTWQAYNTYGGNSFYQGNPAGRAYKLSYNRPFVTRGLNLGRDFLFSNEFPMLQFLERNGYDLSYTSGLDVDHRGALLKNHKVFVSTGHDEYWSGQARTNVEAARDAGVNLAFFSGNEMYWKTRWEPSIDGTATDGRTLVCYKETWSNAKVDPSQQWTGTWRDPRFSPPYDGARPENAVTGTAYMSNSDDLAITVSSTEGRLRLWRNTSLASMPAGTSTALAAHTIGYESDEDLDNGFRPQGLIRLSTTTGATPEYLRDFGNTVTPGTTTHHLTMYRASSGARVFSAGSIQWSWGLSQDHDGNGAPADSRIQQATLNILADMGASASTLMPGLAPASPSADVTAPTATITSPADGTTFANGGSVTITGTAADVGGVVAGVEVSTDGSTWHPATGTTSWSYTFTMSDWGPVSLRARAVDDTGNIGSPASVGGTAKCPCSLFGDATPTATTVNDSDPVELGVRFVPSVDGFVNGIRFYKGSLNTGTHTGSLWTTAGVLLAQGTFTNETASGWQTLVLDAPVAVSAGTTYVASYFAPNGRYSNTTQYFAPTTQTSPPLTAPGRPDLQNNGVYLSSHGFPTQSYQNTNYWVDVLFSVDDTSPPVVVGRTPLPGSASVASTVTLRAVFAKSIDPSTLSFGLTGPSGPVTGTSAYDVPTRTATFRPAAALGHSTQYTASVSASNVGGVPMSAPVTWSFTTAATDPVPGACPCSIWSDSATPAVVTSNDAQSTELGVRFTADVDGEISGVRFYKGPQNVGIHVGSLWTSSGSLLASATFVGESSSGWQTVTFSTPVAITANTTYFASYRAPAGEYSLTSGGLASPVDSTPLHTVTRGGAFTYPTGFPTTLSDNNYFVDVLFVPTDPPPTVSAYEPANNATSISVSTTASASFGAPIRAGSAVVSLRSSSGADVPGTVSYDATARRATFTPTAPLDAGATYTATASGALSLSGFAMTPFSWSFTTTTPPCASCTLFSDSTVPTTVDGGDGAAVSVGVKFSVSQSASVTGVRFYKSTANTGTHTGSLWNSAGVRLATGTFNGESASGWQTLTFATPVALVVGDTYVVSYYAPNGHYSVTNSFFTTPWQNGVLTAPAGANGVFRYGGDSYPDGSFASTNYWVDPVITLSTAPDTDPPTVSSRTPVNGETSVATSVQPSATFSEPVNQATLSLTLKDAANQTVPGTVAYDASSRTATLTPGAPLNRGVTYTVSASAADLVGNAMTAPVSWSFTTAQPSPTPGQCACSLWDETAVPGTITVQDAQNVELGVKFTTDSPASITGVRFYKGPKNVGTHTGSLWDSAGNRLATATFSGESAAGWQTVTFPTPVAVTAGTTYVASYTTSGFYSMTQNGLATPVDQPPLHTPASAGLYLYGAGFPTNVSTSNYWVDVVVGDTTPPVISAVAGSGSGTSATVTWTTNEPATTRVDYGTTTALGSSATGASGTSHSVTIGGLTNGATYYYRVTSVDPAGNSTTDPVGAGAPRSFTIPDTVPPTVTAVAASGSGTSATVTWTTNESATTQVDYGTTASLGSTATGASGTSHSVSLTGLTNGATYYYRVTSADAAGNSTTDPVSTSAPRTFTIADTVPPVIGSVASSGSGTTATITWTTNESATSSVTYGTTTSLGSTAAGATGTSHTVTLTGLAPNTRYYYRVTSADAAGNGSTSPATSGAPAAYVPTVSPVTQSTVADFGTGSGGYVSRTDDGEVLDTPTLGQEFTGTTLPTGWTSTALVTGGTSTFANGLATVSGSRLRTNTIWAAGSNFSAAATMAAGQSLGWGSVASGSTNVTASFVMDATGALSASVNDGLTNVRTIAIPGTFTGGSHEYRIDRPTGNAVFYIDGTQVATSAFAPSVSLLVMLVDPTTTAPVLTSDWVRVGPYAASSTFTSGVIDAGATVGWDTLTSDSLVPANTTLTIQVRSGSNANAGSGSWTTWATVPAGGSITRSSRYIQYRLQFTSTGSRFTTASVRSVQLAFHVL